MFGKKAAKQLLCVCLGSFLFICVLQAETEVNFSNKLASDDIVTIRKDDVRFSGVYDEMEFSLTSDRVEVSITAEVDWLFDEDSVPKSLAWNEDDFDWEILFRPVDVFAIGFSTDFLFQGSYLAVEDDNTALGKMGSDGLTFAFPVIDGLTFAATLPFSFGSQNFFNNDDTYIDAGFGAEYVTDTFAFGAAVHDVVNNFSFGVYGAFTGLENLSLYAGYAYKDEEGICDVVGDHLVNFSALYGADIFYAAADFVTEIAGDGHFYIGAEAGYNFAEAQCLSLGATMKARYSAVDESEFVIKPAYLYTFNSMGEIKIGVDISFCGSDFDKVCFPVSWKYSF